ncbi:MAG: glutamate synthase subunit alpha, partial [Gaiellaceae bacterium]
MPLPHPQTGLYDPSFEHDSCGVAFVVRPDGARSHETVERALAAVANLEHRGAVGADKDTGDGAGILVQVPDAFFRALMPDLPPVYGVGTLFGEGQEAVEAAVEAEGARLLGWRDVPVDEAHVGRTARAAMPRIRQFFVAADGLEGDALERKLYVIRRVAESANVVVPSLSSRTLVYKGMLTAPQLACFYPDLRDERFASALALVHSRFSTHTFPSWELAHPYRMIAHNGEINTLRGNVNWMRARESQLASEL